MESRARDGALLAELVGIAVKYCRFAEKNNPRRGRGRRPDTADWVLAAMIAVAILHRRKSKSSQLTWWASRRDDFHRFFGGEKFPCRSTFYDRYRRVHQLLQQAIALQGGDAVRKGWADADCAAFDKSLIAGRGRPWSPWDRRQNRVPKRVDRDTTWSYSTHHGWVQGYSYEVAVTAGTTGVNWPLAASVDTASRSEQKSCLEKLAHLPPQTTIVLADAGYDSNAVGEAVEWTADGQRTGCRFLCPEVPRPNTGKPRQSGSRQSRERRRHRRLRESRQAYFACSQGRRLYARRKTSVEPFNGRFKQLFELENKTWHWGLPNNRTAILAALFAYQILLTYNHRHRKRNACVKAILDGL